MIGDGNCRGAFVDGAARIFSSKDTFDEDGAAPQFANPAEVAPGHGGFGEGGGDIHERHGALAGDDDVGKGGQTAIEQETREPSWARENLRKKPHFFKGAAADEFLDAVAAIALADSGDGRIDGDDKGGKSGAARAINCGLGGGAATHQIELVEDGSGRGGFYVFQLVSRYGGENVGGARVAGGASGAHFAHGVHQAAVADRSQQEWEREIEAENAGAQVAIGDGDRMAGTEGDILIDAAILAEGDLAFGAAIEIVEDGPGHAAPSEGAEIRDADHSGRGDGAGGSSHSVMAVPGVVNRPWKNWFLSRACHLSGRSRTSKQRIYRSAEALRHPKLNTEFFSRLLKHVDGITDENQARNFRHALRGSASSKLDVQNEGSINCTNSGPA